MNAKTKTELLRQIKEEVVSLKESLAKQRIKDKVFPVIGEGNHNAHIIFVGEAPGRTEAQTGRPFCGAAGKILDRLLDSIGLNRKEIYITNLVKDRPPFNRDPLPEEIKIYSPFLDRQIEIIKPKVIATLGRFSMAYLMNEFGKAHELKSISQIHGKLFEAKASWGEIKIIPLYHPAVSVYNAKTFETLKQDFKILENFK